MANGTHGDEMELQKEFLVANRSGIHCRAAVKLVDAIGGFDATVHLIAGNCMAAGGSILDIMALGCVQGSRVTVRTSGAEARQAMQAVERIFDEKFGEE